MKKEFVRNPYNYDSDELSNETGLKCLDPSLTSQEFLEESDINYIAERFMKTGEAPQVVNMPTPGDFRGIFDFQDAMNLIVQAKAEFMTLPAKIRSRFDNDPAKIIDFLNDEANRKEAIALGLVQEPPEPKIDPAPAPDPKSADAPASAPKEPGAGKPKKE